ncbi:MAG: PRC-barrel domain containing protein, partial [Planctomycetota bacterium]
MRLVPPAITGALVVLALLCGCRSAPAKPAPQAAPPRAAVALQASIEPAPSAPA